MGKTVEWIDHNMSAMEFAEWQAFYLYVEPFGGKFLDMQFASLRMQNYGGTKKLSLDDFLLYDYSMQTPEEKEQERLDIAKLNAEVQASELRNFFKSKAVKRDNNNIIG